MKRPPLFVKFIVALLTAAALVIGVVSCMGVVQLVRYNLYADSIHDYLYKNLDTDADKLAQDLAERYVVMNLSNCNEETLSQLGYRRYVEGGLILSGFNEENYNYTIATKNGEVLESVTKALTGETLVFATRCSSPYPVIVQDEDEINELFGRDFVDSYEQEFDFSDEPITVREYDSPEFVITVTILQDSAMIPSRTSLSALYTLHELRHVLIFLLAFCAIIFFIGIAYLCVVAGKSSKGAANHRSANYIPLDIYAAAGTGLIIWLYSLVGGFVYNWFSSGKDYNPGTLSLVSLVFLGIALIFLGFIYAVATQVKVPKAYWFRHLFLYWLGGKIARLLHLLPVVWRLFLPGFVCMIGVAGGIVFAFYGNFLPLIIVGSICLFVLCYCCYAIGCLVQGSQRMAQGDLNAKLNTRYLVGIYRQCADSLNELADVAILAARKQMQADRMRTELITNVSHDIKTPLTSIINYVDILQQTQNQEDASQHLEVLGRQSLRLKKLIEDLMELSKASSGSMAVHILPLNAEETVNQALGEFSDKLALADLSVVFQPPAEPITMLADGRMSWRVLSNLLSNVVKYALPGTRVYLELVRQEGWVQISLKNISREPLNISAEELTERFVRGDASRNTEGSGLGLNIAKSLMELQKGRLDLQIDGDLFKATLLFPIQEQA